jgi:hypothetical protein
MNDSSASWKESDFRCFEQNRARFPSDDLLRYLGQHIAWSLDGSRILANGVTEEEVEERLQGAGIDPGQAVLEYIPATDSVLL